MNTSESTRFHTSKKAADRVIKDLLVLQLYSCHIKI